MNSSETNPPEHLRLFVAIRVPEEVKNEIERAQEELRRAVPGRGLRWTTQAQFHLTLRFLGTVEAQRAGALTDALREACRGFAPLQLRAEGIGFFPDARRPRVVWVGMQDRDGLLPRVQGAVQAATRDFTAEAPEERFMGHVTVGRIKAIQRSEEKALAGMGAGMAKRLFGEWTAREVELVRSELLPKGASHTCQATVPLLGQAPGTGGQQAAHA
jgi:2'-5' RNA ligase